MNSYTASPATEYCNACGIPTVNKCKTCQASFCSEEHELARLDRHKEPCKPFKIHTDYQQHHYVVATRRIHQDTVILQEPPLILAPSETQSVCLGCFTILGDLATHPCTRCGWPFCSEKCQHNPNHKPECYYISRKPNAISVKTKLRVNLLSRCILILRCLYQKKHNPPVWLKINRLEPRYWERTSRNYRTEKAELIDTLYKYFGLQDEFTEDEILKVYSICLTNKEDAPVTNIYPTAMYELSPMFEHHCRANCYKSIDSGGIIRIIAGVPIGKGEHLSICYTNPLCATTKRRLNLEITKFLKCECDRCEDVTEMSTNISAVKCQNSLCSGLLLPQTFVKPAFHWTCRICSCYVPHTQVVMLLTYLEEQIKTMKVLNHCDAIKMYIEMNEKHLPEYHGCMLLVKYAMLDALGGLSSETMAKISPEDLTLKENLCQQFIYLLRIIAPAEKKYMAYVYYNYQLTMEEVCRRRILDRANILNYKEHLQLSEWLLTEVQKCIKFMSIFTTEGGLYNQVTSKLQRLQEQLSQFER